MAQLSDIKKHMQSVAAIQKMSKAMQLISSVKMRQSRRLFAQALPFFSHCAATLMNMLAEHPDFHSPMMELREKPPGSPWHILLLVMTSDRGLAGTYNTDVLKATRSLIAAREAACAEKQLNPVFDIRVMGRVGRETLTRAGYPVDQNYAFSINDPDYYEAADLSERLLALYADGAADEIYMIYTRMQSPLIRDPIYTRLLPTDLDGLMYLFRSLREQPEAKILEQEEHFEPNRHLNFEYPDEIGPMLSYLYGTTLSGLVYGALTEAYASEQTARMTSMDNASRNSEALIRQLEKARNRLRQTQITMELNEIVSGAEIVSADRQSGRTAEPAQCE